MPNDYLGVAPPPDTLTQDYYAASKSSPEDLYSLTTRAAGTSLAPKILQSAQLMQDGSKRVEEVLNAVKVKGGIDTPEGRIAGADAVLKSFDKYQPNTSFLGGLSQGLMGNKNWRNAASQGVVRPVFTYGDNGQTAIAYMAENCDVPIKVLDASGQPMTDQQYLQGGFNKFKDVTQSPGYLANVETVKKYADANAKHAEAANIGASVMSTVAQNSLAAQEGWMKLFSAGTNLTSKDMNELQQFSSKGQVLSDAISKARNELLQAQDNDSRAAAVDNINKTAVEAKVPMIFSVGKDGTIKDQNGKTYTTGTLASLTNNFNNSSSKEQQFHQNREQIIKSAVYQKMDGNQKALFDDIVNRVSSNEILKSKFQEAHGSYFPVAAPSIPYQLGQSFKVGMSNALVDQSNAEMAAVYQAKLNEALKSGAIVIPGSTSAAFSSSPESQAINSKYKKLIENVFSMPDPAETRQANELAAEKTVKSRSIAKPEPSIFSPAQQTRLTQTPTEAQAATPPAPTVTNLPKGIPAGSTAFGWSKTGQRVYKAPDGTNHVPD